MGNSALEQVSSGLDHIRQKHFLAILIVVIIVATALAAIVTVTAVDLTHSIQTAPTEQLLSKFLSC